MKPVSQSGKPVLVRRAAFNEIVESVTAFQRRKFGQTSPLPPNVKNPGEIYILNGTSEDLRQWDALALYYPMVTPADDRPEFSDRLVFVCDIPASSNDPVAIASEPIPAGEVGRAVVAGLTPAYLTRTAGNTDRFAKPQEGSGVLISDKSGYPIAWETPAADGVERIALVLLPGGGGGSPDPMKRCKIVSVEANTLTVVKWNGTTWSGANSTVCKPYLLREITSRAGLTYTYTNGYTRTADNGSATENQIIVPAYVAGDEIYTATVNSTGILDTGSNEILDVDINTGGRAWARV